MNGSLTNALLASRWRAVTIGSVLALIAVVLAWQLLPTPTLEHALLAVFLCLPLLLPLRGLWLGKRYTYRWATLCVLPYFIVGLTEVVANPSSRAWTAALLVLALTWFVGLVAYLRVTAPQ